MTRAPRRLSLLVAVALALLVLANVAIIVVCARLAWPPDPGRLLYTPVSRGGLGRAHLLVLAMAAIVAFCWVRSAVRRSTTPSERRLMVAVVAGAGMGFYCLVLLTLLGVEATPAAVAPVACSIGVSVLFRLLDRAVQRDLGRPEQYRRNVGERRNGPAA